MERGALADSDGAVSMRLPLVPEIESRDGTSDKDERLTNVLSETDQGINQAVIRPGLVSVITAAGAGGNLTAFNGTLVGVFGTTVGVGESQTSVGTVAAGQFDFCASPL